MNVFKKYKFSFVLALAFHLGILAMFGMSYFSEPDIVKAKPLPEIIQAAVLDDKTIMEEANRLKENKKNKEIAQQKKQQELEDNRKKEQALFEKAKEKRLKEEQKVKDLKKKRQDDEVKEKKLEKERKEKAIEEKKKAEQIKKDKAKAKKQKEEKDRLEKKRVEKERKAKEKKRKADLKAEKKRKADLAAKRKADAARKEAERQMREEDDKMREAQEQRITQSTGEAIQQKIYNTWRKPPSAKKGMRCTLRITLRSDGVVINVQIINGSRDDVFDRSATIAVRKASPLPVPNDIKLFNKKFKSFRFDFKQ